MKSPSMSVQANELVTTEESETEKQSMNTTALIPEKTQEGLEAIIDLQHYNSLHKVIQITAWVYCLVNNARLKNRETCKVLNMEETREAEFKWIQEMQAKVKSCENFQQLQDQLNLRDENGILKCHGHLEHAETEAWPVLLPRDHVFTALATKVLHMGVSMTLAKLCPVLDS